MQETLFTIDNTDAIVLYVKQEINKFKNLTGKCNKKMILHFIRKGVGIYATQLMFHERIDYVESILDEYFGEYDE